MAPVFRALSDPSRRHLLDQLFERDGQTLGELCEYLPEMTRFGVMKHLGVLERTGLIRSRKHGRTRTCTLEQKNLAAAERWFADQRSLWASRYQNLDSLLESLNGEERES